MSSCGKNITLPVGPRGPQGPQGIQGIQGIQGVQGIQGDAGISLEWLGTLTSPPGSPTLNQAYYNSVDKVSYVWDGNSWEKIAQDGAQGAPGVGASPNVQEEGSVVNTVALTVINFTGAATATETSPGVVKVDIPVVTPGVGVTAIDGPDAATVLSEQPGPSNKGLPAGTVADSDDTPTIDLFIKGAAASNDSGRSYASSFPTAIADTTTLVSVANTSGSTKKYLMVVNLTMEYVVAVGDAGLGNIRVYSGTGNGTTFTYKAGSAQYAGPKASIVADLVMPVAFTDVITVADGDTGYVCMDLPALAKASTLGIATETSGGARLVALNTNIIQLD